MWRVWFGTALLLTLLSLCLFVTGYCGNAYKPVSGDLDAAAVAAMAGDTAGALAAARHSRQQWDAMWHKTAAFTDHEPMDEIDSLFALLEILGLQKNQEEFPALCAQLSQLTDALAHSHSLHWWTLL